MEYFEGQYTPSNAGADLDAYLYPEDSRIPIFNMEGESGITQRNPLFSDDDNSARPATNGTSGKQRSTDFHINTEEVLGKPQVKKHVTIKGEGESSDSGDMYLVVDGAVGGAQSVTVGQPFDPDYLAYKNKGKPREKRQPAPDESRFADYAAENFLNRVSSTFGKTMLQEPLLTSKNINEKMAALSIWIVILRFMGDIPEPPAPPSDNKPKRRIPLMAKIYSSLNGKFKEKNLEEVRQLGKDLIERANQHFTGSSPPLRSQSVTSTSSNDDIGQIETISAKKNSVKKGFMSLMFYQKKSRKSIKDLEDRPKAEQQQQENYSGYPPLNEDISDEIDKIHFIVGHGIIKPGLRDEIFCQICKQLRENPGEASEMRGWQLLSLALGCFPPSSKLAKYIRSFIKDAPHGFDKICVERLRRTITNGSRNQAPSWLELNTLKIRRHLIVKVTCMDGQEISVPIDSATIAYEICDYVANQLNMRDCFGFSLYIALAHRVCSLGSGADHVMDAISEFEQYARDRGCKMKDAPWRLFFRKETFTPWHDVTEDDTATSLIFMQVIKGMQYGEYKVDDENEAARLMAQRYYVEYGSDVDKERMEKAISTYLPENLQKLNKPPKFWSQKVQGVLQNAEYVQLKAPPIKVKQNLVSYAILKWPILFSRFYEAFKYAGPSLPKNEVLLAVNCLGVYILDEKEQQLAGFSYAELVGCSCSRTEKQHGQTVTLTPIEGDEYCFTAPNAEDITDLVAIFLNGLRDRANYAIAIEDYELSMSGDTSVLSFHRGDLIAILGKQGTMVPSASGATDDNLQQHKDDKVPGILSFQSDSGEPDWYHGECLRTGKRGDFPTEFVHLIASMTKPNPTVLSKVHRYVMSQKLSGKKGGKLQFLQISDARGAYPWTGESYA